MEIKAKRVEDITVSITPKECFDALCNHCFQDFKKWSLSESGDSVIMQVDESYHGSPFYIIKEERTSKESVDLYKHLKEIERLLFQ